MEYAQALQQAIIYIEQHLKENIKVEEVAYYVGYSYYHLNRKFLAIIGESIGGYIKKRRLSKAANALLNTNDKIIDIAIESAFASADAFSRAFKAKYKVSPQEYRNKGIQTFVSNKQSLGQYQLEHLSTHLTVYPRILEIPQITVIGVKEKTTLQLEKIKALWEDFYTSLDKEAIDHSNYCKFGIYEYVEENMHYTLHHQMGCNELLTIEASACKKIPKQWVTKVIPAGRYAVFSHYGSLDTLFLTQEYIWGTWVVSTKEKLDTRETFEVYEKRFLGYDNKDSIMDIYIAIK